MFVLKCVGVPNHRELEPDYGVPGKAGNPPRMGSEYPAIRAKALNLRAVLYPSVVWNPETWIGADCIGPRRSWRFGTFPITPLSDPISSLPGESRPSDHVTCERIGSGDAVSYSKDMKSRNSGI